MLDDVLAKAHSVWSSSYYLILHRYGRARLLAASESLAVQARAGAAEAEAAAALADCLDAGAASRHAYAPASRWV